MSNAVLEGASSPVSEIPCESLLKMAFARLHLTWPATFFFSRIICYFLLNSMAK
jgi:hypothetical protein